MIKKLVKYDIMKMSRILVYIYVVALAFAIITRLINIGNSIQIIDIIGKVFAGITYSVIINILINNFVHILNVFINSFYKDESYLTHTLPVTKGQLLASKIISALVVTLVSFLVSVVAILIIHYSSTMFDTLAFLIEMAVSGFNMSATLFVVIVSILLFLQLFCITLMTFTAVVKANRYNSNRILKGLIWFCIYYFGASIITLLVAVTIFAITGNIGQVFASQLSQFSFLTLMWVAVVMYLIYSVFYTFICYRLFNKGVNID